MAFFFAVLLFSLAGIPPLAGFFAKFYVFLAAIKAGLYALAVIGVLASVVGAYYYLTIVKIMYFDEPRRSFEPMPREQVAVLAVAGLFNLLFFFTRRRSSMPRLRLRNRCFNEWALRSVRSALRAGHRLASFDSVGSTNAEALTRARSGESGPLWIAARAQTAGRGRRGTAAGKPPRAIWPQAC